MNLGFGAPNVATLNLRSRGHDGIWAHSIPTGFGSYEVDAPFIYKYDSTTVSVSLDNIVRANG